MPEQGGLACRRWCLEGRVQGVGFRWYVVSHARILGIRGWVRNTESGAVEVVGLASEGTLDRFDTLLARGPPAALVMKVTRDDVPHNLVDAKSFGVKH